MTKTKEIKKENIRVIDAQGQVLGRLASQVVLLLRGKHEVDFVPYKEPKTKVVIKNVDKIKITGRKLSSKFYIKHTGYPGGLKKKKMADIFLQDPKWVFRHAVLGMLPKNKLRNKMIKNLSFE